MLNESVKQASVLTEEELTLNEKALKNSVRAKAMYESDHILVEEIIASHRALNSRNAKLVHENDELMAENVKLKAILTDISTHVMDITSKDVYYNAYLEVKMNAYKALEELNHE